MSGPTKIYEKLLKLYHGGRKFDQWNPATIGLGEGAGGRSFLAQGPGLYAGDTKLLGKVYMPYGGENATLTELLVDPERIINPAEKLSPFHKDIIRAAESELDKLGLNASKYGIRSAFLSGRPYRLQEVRETLAKTGLGGLRQNLHNEYGQEYVIYDPDIIKSIRTMDPSEFKQGGLAQWQD